MRQRPAGYDRARHGVHRLKSPDVIADPTVYIDAIAEIGPLFYDEVGAVWVCSGYAEAVEILRDHRRFSSTREHDHAVLEGRGLHVSAELSAMVHEQMLFTDLPEHAAIRSPLNGQFSPGRVRRRADALREIARQSVQGLPADGVVDLVTDFAATLAPALVAYLLGMPGREAELTRWAEAYERLLGSLAALPLAPDPKVEEALSHALAELRREATHRLHYPGDDVITSMTTPLAGRTPTDKELFSVAANCIVLLGGGYQTLTHLVSSALLALHDDPAGRRRLRESPASLPAAVDEFMRINGSSQYVARKATADVTVGGTPIAAGERVLVHLAAANLDPRAFTAPRTLDFSRQGPKHLGFGTGRHQCPGAGYAERLACFAIEGFLARYPTYALDAGPDALSWGSHANTRCLAHARVRVSTATGREAPPTARADRPWQAGDCGRVLSDGPLAPAPGGPARGAGCWHEVFEQQARLTPDTPAVEDLGTVLTYRELDQRANGLAHRLRRHGIQPGSVAGVVMERSVEFVIAVLAVAKAGGAFLLAETGCPRERLRTMLTEAAVHLVLSDRTLPARVSAAPVLTTGTDVTHPLPPLTGVSPGDLAYVVFTSGTTGSPKAIAISHGATVNLALAQREIFGLSTGDRVLQFLSPNFDGCVADLTLALLSGATLVLAPADRLVVGPPLVRLLASRQITAVTLTPSVWTALPHTPLPDLRIAAAAGERLPAAWVERWAQPGRRLLNLYGPAETAVLATWHECTSPSPRPPIGKPVANKQVYLLDDLLRPVAPGQEGELWIGGTGIGRYLNRPDLMEERFIRDPASTADRGSLLYRTGDICRQLPDGTLDYVGRRDRQVKIRGHRIELDEVERILETAPGIAACTVHEQNGRIEALILPAGGPIDEAAIRTYLAPRLHSAMVPASFTTVSDLPRTINGKTDRQAATSTPAPPETAAPGAAPDPADTPQRRHSLMTWLVAQQFAKALDVPQRHVQADSDFFDEGGDSLTLAVLLQRLESRTGSAIDAAALITAPTPERIATLLASLETGT